MTAELIGFLAGLAAAAGAMVAFLRLERGRSIAAAYGPEAKGRTGGNALIWPSR